MAVGILSIGLMLVATMFPAAIYLTTVASERTMAAIVADEAFAKIQLFGLQTAPSDDVNDYEIGNTNTIDPNEFSYPPVDVNTNNRQYYWSALFRKIDPNEYLVTVFVARKTSPNHTYWQWQSGGFYDRPKLSKVAVQAKKDDIELIIQDPNQAKYINPPTTILDDATGKIYRVIERKIDEPNVVQLDKGWEDTPLPPDHIWLVPPPESGGKNADIEVFQRIIRF